MSTSSESVTDEDYSDSGNSEVQWGWSGDSLRTGEVIIGPGGERVPVSLGNSSLSDTSEEIRRIRDQMGEIDESSDEFPDISWNSASQDGTDDGVQVSSITSSGTSEHSPLHDIMNEVYLDDVIGILPNEQRMPEYLREDYGLPQRCMGGVSGGQVTGTATSPLELIDTTSDPVSVNENEVNVATVGRQSEDGVVPNDDNIDDIWDGIFDRIDVGGGNSSIVKPSP